LIELNTLPLIILYYFNHIT